jgi:hypothetical protein
VGIGFLYPSLSPPSAHFSGVESGRVNSLFLDDTRCTDRFGSIIVSSRAQKRPHVPTPPQKRTGPARRFFVLRRDSPPGWRGHKRVSCRLENVSCGILRRHIRLEIMEYTSDCKEQLRLMFCLGLAHCWNRPFLGTA